MTIRLVCASTFTAIGLACSSAASARVVVYTPAAVVYAPPPRPVVPAYYPVPVYPVYVTAPPPVVVPIAVPVAAATMSATPSQSAAAATATVAAPPTLNYAVVPAPVVSYAQPVMIVPR